MNVNNDIRHNRIRCLVRIALSITVLCYVFNVHAQSKTFFRYTNDQGRKVFSDVIPPQYTTKGYELMDSAGRVIKVILPELSPEEKARVETERTNARRIAKRDNELLSRYSNVSDIKESKARRLKDIGNSIYSLRLTLKNISKTIMSYQAEAASYERQGENVPKETLSSLTRLQKDRSFIEIEIDRKEQAKQQISNSYDEDIIRFGAIKPVIN
jgi:hypothetical protein